MVDTSNNCNHHYISPDIFSEDRRSLLETSDLIELDRTPFALPTRFQSSKDYIAFVTNFLLNAQSIQNAEEAHSVALTFYLNLGLTPANLQSFFKTYPDFKPILLKTALHLSDVMLKELQTNDLLSGDAVLTDSAPRNFVCEFLAPLVQLEQDDKVFVFAPGRIQFNFQGQAISQSGPQLNLDRYPGLFPVKYGQNQVNTDSAQGLFNWVREDLNRRLDARACNQPSRSHGAFLVVDHYELESQHALSSQSVKVGEQESYSGTLRVNTDTFWVTPLFRPQLSVGTDSSTLNIEGAQLQVTPDSESSALILTTNREEVVIQDLTGEFPLYLHNGYERIEASLQVQIENNINEKPQIELSPKSLGNTAYEFEAWLSDINPKDNHHEFTWQVFVDDQLVREFSETVLNLGKEKTLKTFYLDIPAQSTEQNVSVMATLIDLNHEDNRVETQEMNYTIPARTVQQKRLDEYVARQSEIDEIVHLTGAKRRFVPIDEEYIENHLIEVYATPPDSVFDAIDGLTLVDGSGSMSSNVTSVKEHSPKILEAMHAGLTNDGQLRLATGYYGDQNTVINWRSEFLNSEEENVKNQTAQFQMALENTATAIGPYGQETLWYSLWQLTVGDQPYSFVRGENTYRKIVVLTDYEATQLSAEANIVAIPGDASFDKADALSMLQDLEIDIEIVDFYGNGSYSKRSEFTLILAELLEGQEQREFLQAALQDHEDDVRSAASSALYLLPKDEIQNFLLQNAESIQHIPEEGLIQLYQNLNTPWALNRLEEIAHKQDPDAYNETLLKALLEADADLAFQYIETLKDVYNDDVLVIFLYRYDEYLDDPRFWNWLIHNLPIEIEYRRGTSSQPTAIKQLSNLLWFLENTDGHETKIRQIYTTLYQKGYHAEGFSPEHWKNIVLGYVKHHPENYQDVFEKNEDFFDGDNGLIKESLEALNKNPKTLSQLIKILKSDSSSFNQIYEAMEALQNFPSEAVEDVLIQIIWDDDRLSDFKTKALVSLYKINRQKALEVALEWQQKISNEAFKNEQNGDSQYNSAIEEEALVTALRSFEDTDAIPVITGLLSNLIDGDGEVRLTLVEILSNTQSVDALPVLQILAQMQLPNSFINPIQEEVCRAVQKIDSPQGIPILKMALETTDSNIKMDVLEALESLGVVNDDVVEIVRHIYNTTKGQDRAKAAVTAKRLGITIDDQDAIDDMIDLFLQTP